MTETKHQQIVLFVNDMATLGRKAINTHITIYSRMCMNEYNVKYYQSNTFSYIFLQSQPYLKCKIKKTRFS